MSLTWNANIGPTITRLRDAAGDGAAIFLVGKVKEVLSVPAPRVRLQREKDKAFYYVAGWELGSKLAPGVNPTRTGLHFRKNKQTGQLERVRVHYEVSPATPGAPPRKLSGRLRASITWERAGPGVWRVGTNVKYGRRHELGNHPFLRITALRYKPELEARLGQALHLPAVAWVPTNP